MRILYQVLLLKYIENSKSCCTCQVVATEGSTQLTIYRSKLRRNQHATHRETIADTLGYGDEIWLDAQPLVSKELTASAITALDFIANQDGAVFLAGCLQALSKLRSYHVATTYALDRLNDTSADIALGKFLLPSLQIIDRKIGYVTIVIDRSDDLRIICYLYGKGSSSVESLLYRKHAGSSVGEGSQLQGILVCFGTRVDEEELIIFITAYLAQTLSEFHLQLVDDRVGIETQVVQLIGEHLHIVRMAMTDADNGMTAIEVEVFLTLVVPYLAALSFYNINIEKRIYVVKFHVKSMF